MTECTCKFNQDTQLLEVNPSCTVHNTPPRPPGWGQYEKDSRIILNDILSGTSPEVAINKAFGFDVHEDIVKAVPLVEKNAIIAIHPEEDEAVKKLLEEVKHLQEHAKALTITGPDDVKLATDDLGMAAVLGKSLDELKESYYRPIKGHLDAVTAVFNPVQLSVADYIKTMKAKVIAYNAAVEARRQEAQRLIDEANALAKKQAEFNGGEFTVDTRAVVVPAAPAKTIRAQAASSTTRMVPTYEVVDFKELPDDYKVADAGKLYRIIKAANGAITIPGVKITMKPDLTVRATK